MKTYDLKNETHTAALNAGGYKKNLHITLSYQEPGSYVLGNYHGNPLAAEFSGYCESQNDLNNLLNKWVDHYTHHG